MNHSQTSTEEEQEIEPGEIEDVKRRFEEQVARLNSFRDELITIVAKSQDAFERQLSFITAGALALSIGFIKDVVTEFDKSAYKGLLGWGWSLLVGTLLLNCISHLVAGQYHNKSIKEINESKYNPEKALGRNKKISYINKWTVATMIIGIALILLFIIINTLI